MDAKYCDKCGTMYARTGNRIVINGLGDEVIKMDMCDTCQDALDRYLFPNEQEETEDTEEEEKEEKEEEVEETAVTPKSVKALVPEVKE